MALLLGALGGAALSWAIGLRDSGSGAAGLIRQGRLARRATTARKLERRLRKLEAELEATRGTSTKVGRAVWSPGAKRAARGRFFEAAALQTPIVAAESDGLTYFVASADRGPGRSLFVEGRRGEAATLRAALTVLQELGRPARIDATFLDIGANIGTTTIPALLEHGFASAVACEPDPVNLRLLRLNLLANGVEARASAMQLALSDEDGTVDLARSRSNWGDHRVVDGVNARKLRNRDLIQVERTTVDGLLARLEIPAGDVGLAWIDAQGHEAQILAGSEQLILARTPIVFELWPRVLDRNGDLSLLVALFDDLDGQLFDLREPGRRRAEPRPVESLAELVESYLRAGGHTDLLLVPEVPSAARQT